MSDGILFRDPPQYYVRNLELSIESEVGEVVWGNVAVELDMSNPAIENKDDDTAEISCECNIHLDLYQFVGSNDDEDDDSTTEDDDSTTEDVGEVDIEAWIVVEGKQEQLEEQIEIWTDEGYYETDENFRMVLESEILSDVLSPVSAIIDNSFKGIIPRIEFEESDHTDSEASDEDQ